MPQSPKGAINRRPFDVETGAPHVGCADSCSSFDDFPKAPGSIGGSEIGSPTWDTPRSILSCKHGGLVSMNGTLGSGKLDVLEEGALDGSPDGKSPSSSGWQLKYKRGASVVAVCLLLTIGSFIVPKSGHGLGSVKVSVRDLRSKARQGFARPAAASAQQSDAAISAAISTKVQQRRCQRQQLPETISTQQAHIKGIDEEYVMDQPQQRGQWLVSARLDGVLSIMTPVYPDDENLSLLLNQLRSANKFLNMDSFREWVFITPEEHIPLLVHFLEREVVRLPCLQPKKMRVVGDEACAPELRPVALEDIAGKHSRSISGWVKQQVVKLACSFTIQTPYFLITDADTFFIRELEALTLLDQQDCTPDSSICDLQRKVQFRARNELQAPVQWADQKEWIKLSAEVLNISAPKDTLQTPGVTPQILSRAVMDPLVVHLETKVSRPGETWRAYLLRKQAERLANDATRDLPSWTEYDIYWEFAHHAKLWDKHHVHAELQQEKANLWTKKEWPTWNPCNQTELDRNNGYWAVVQSRLQLPGELIWERLKPCMEHGIKNAGSVADAKAAR
jgi:hypothetical protein